MAYSVHYRIFDFADGYVLEQMQFMNSCLVADREKNCYQFY